jgi:hypothetical protein
VVGQIGIVGVVRIVIVFVAAVVRLLIGGRLLAARARSARGLFRLITLGAAGRARVLGIGRTGLPRRLIRIVVARALRRRGVRIGAAVAARPRRLIIIVVSRRTIASRLRAGGARLRAIGLALRTALFVTADRLRLTLGLITRLGLAGLRMVRFALARISTIGLNRLAVRAALGLYSRDARARIRAVYSWTALSRRAGKFCEGVFLADQAGQFGERILTAACARVIHTRLGVWLRLPVAPHRPVHRFVRHLLPIAYQCPRHCHSNTPRGGPLTHFFGRSDTQDGQPRG